MRLQHIGAVSTLGFAMWLSAPLLSASDLRYPIGRSSNDVVEISANLLLDKDEIKQAIGPNIAGADLGGYIVVVQVTVRPLVDTPVKVWLDDFTLFSNKDGQRVEPFQPSQIAGTGEIIVKTREQKTSGIMMGGPISTGTGLGSNAGPSADEIEVKNAEDNTDSPLLVALRQKQLPEKSVTDPVTGYLYFRVDGKVKAKNLELFYKTPSGKLALRFAPEKGEKTSSPK
jgi:hypothetical protein